MLRLAINDTVYIKSTEDVTCIINGFTVLGGVRTKKILYNYKIAQNTAREVYCALVQTDITDISIISPNADASIAVYINGTAAENQVYESVMRYTYTMLYNNNAWFENSFLALPPNDDLTKVSTKSINITAPTASEDITMFFTEVAIRIVEVYDVIRGGLASVTWNVAHGKDRTVLEFTIFDADRTTTSNTGTSTISMDNPEIPANSWVWLTTSAVTGIVEDFDITLRFI